LKFSMSQNILNAVLVAPALFVELLCPHFNLGFTYSV
jgi:hypothetical protein